MIANQFELEVSVIPQEMEAGVIPLKITDVRSSPKMSPETYR